MAEVFEVYKKGFNYTIEADKLLLEATRPFDAGTSEFFEAALKVKEDWIAKYEATKAKVNEILYGNAQGVNKDRSDLYLKIVRRNPKYKNWRNFSIAFLAAITFMQIFGLIYHFIPRTEMAYIPFVIMAYLAILLFWGLPLFFQIKSFKYDPAFERSRENDKWLDRYFASASDLINATYYLIARVDTLEEVKKRFELIDKYNALVRKYNELVEKENAAAFL